MPTNDPISQLKNAKTPKARLAALEALQALGPKAAPALELLPPLLAAVQYGDDRVDPAVKVAHAAMDVMKAVGAPALPALKKLISPKTPVAAGRAAQVLSAMGSDIVMKNLPLLVKAMALSGEWRPVADAGPAVVPHLAELLRKTRDEKAIDAASEALGALGGDASPAVPALVDTFNRCGLGTVLVALQKIGDPGATPVLLEIDDVDGILQLAAQSAGHRAKVIAAVQAHVDDGDDRLAEIARRALKALKAQSGRS